MKTIKQHNKGEKKMETKYEKTKISEKNQEKLEKWASEIDGRATKRIFDFDNIKNIEGNVYDHLKKYGVSKKNAKGLNFTCSFFKGKIPNSYKYSFDYTIMDVEIGATGFFVLNIRRVVGYTGAMYKEIEFNFGKKHIETIMEHAIKQAKTI